MLRAGVTERLRQLPALANGIITVHVENLQTEKHGLLTSNPCGDLQHDVTVVCWVITNQHIYKLEGGGWDEWRGRCQRSEINSVPNNIRSVVSQAQITDCLNISVNLINDILQGKKVKALVD